MLGLSTEAVRDYWQRLDPQLAAQFAHLEQMEDWVVDDQPAVADQIIRLGRAMTGADAAGRLAGVDPERLLFFLVHISSSKAFRIIQWMDQTQEGLGSRTLQVLLSQEGEGVFSSIADPLLAGTMLQRLRALHNEQYFRRLLAADMLDSVARAIQHHREKRGSHAT